MPDTRTGPLVQKLADGIREDLAEAASHLQRGFELMRQLEGETRGVNGLSSLLKSKADSVSAVISLLEEEAVAIDKKLLGAGRPLIHESVDEGLAEDVAAAKADA